jgi:hypothetical protein
VGGLIRSLKFKVKNLKITPPKKSGFLGIMEKFRHKEGSITILGRIAKQFTLFFGNFGAAKLVIDHLSGRGGQLNLNISPACLSTPECAQNIIPYVAIAILGVAVENIFWRNITTGRDGTERRDGGFKYQ